MSDAHAEAMCLIAQARKLGDEERQEHVDLVLKAADLHPDCMDVQQALAFAHWQCGNKVEAVDAQRKVIQMGNDLECPNLIFGHQLADAGLVEELEAHLRERWRRRPDQLFWGRELGRNLMKAGATDRAEVAFREFLEQHPTDHRAVSELVTMLDSAERLPEAHQVLDYYGPKIPASEYHLLRGDLFAQEGRRDAAEQEWQLCLMHQDGSESELVERVADSREYYFESGRERWEAESKALLSGENLPSATGEGEGAPEA